MEADPAVTVPLRPAPSRSIAAARGAVAKTMGHFIGKRSSCRRRWDLRANVVEADCHREVDRGSRSPVRRRIDGFAAWKDAGARTAPVHRAGSGRAVGAETLRARLFHRSRWLNWLIQLVAPRDPGADGEGRAAVRRGSSDVKASDLFEPVFATTVPRHDDRVKITAQPRIDRAAELGRYRAARGAVSTYGVRIYHAPFGRDVSAPFDFYGLISCGAARVASRLRPGFPKVFRAGLCPHAGAAPRCRPACRAEHTMKASTLRRPDPKLDCVYSTRRSAIEERGPL